MSFLSTLSLRRATVPYHERSGAQCFSIHALLAESDRNKHKGQALNDIFLSTLSLRRATVAGSGSGWTSKISIHALLAESDLFVVLYLRGNTYFYPRSPCGERPGSMNINPPSTVISIHALLAESDSRSDNATGFPLSISIHALLAESDNIRSHGNNRS